MGHLIRQGRLAVFAVFLVCLVGSGAICAASAQAATASTEAQRTKLEVGMKGDSGVVSSIDLAVWAAVAFAAAIVVVLWLLRPKGLSMIKDPSHL